MVWTLTGEPSTQLFEAGRALHWALQVPASFAATLPQQKDDAHTSFRWRGALGALCSEVDSAGFRAGLRLHDLTLLLFKEEALYSKYPLIHKTLQQGYKWLEAALSKATGSEATRFNAGKHAAQLHRPGYDLPLHAVTAGATFQANDLYKEVAKWYTNAATVLEEVRRTHKGSALGGAFYTASPVRCRPYSFDIATLLTVRENGAALEDGETYTIGVGLIPGDADITEPYWYVTPRPAPATPNLPALNDGHWHTSGWVGAVLPASAMTTESADAQALQVEAFFRSAVAASRALLKDSS